MKTEHTNKYVNTLLQKKNKIRQETKQEVKWTKKILIGKSLPDLLTGKESH